MPSIPPTRRLPAEWELQRGVMLTWPHAGGDWRDLLEQVERVFLAVAVAIAKREALLVNCADRAQADRVGARLLAAGAPARHLYLAVTPSDDTWARDHGPLTVYDNGRPRLLDFRFNGWGGKYPAERDNAISRRLATEGWFGDCPMESVDLVLEGGSIDSDGEGTLLTTAACLLHPQRNPDLLRPDIEARFTTMFGAARVLWLEHGCVEGDDTDGHIDMLARFADPRTLVYQSCDESGYSCYRSLKAMEQELRALRDSRNHPYRLVPLPWPQPKYDSDRQRMPASYANFLLLNGAVLMPTYRDDADVEAARVLQGCFPDRELIGIDCLPLIRQHGSLHCLTMQLPADVPLRQGRTRPP